MVNYSLQVFCLNEGIAVSSCANNHVNGKFEAANQITDRRPPRRCVAFGGLFDTFALTLSWERFLKQFAFFVGDKLVGKTNSSQEAKKRCYERRLVYILRSEIK